MGEDIMIFKRTRAWIVSVINRPYATYPELKGDVERLCGEGNEINNIHKTIRKILTINEGFAVVYHMRIRGYNRFMGKLTSVIFPPRQDCTVDIREIGPGFILHHGNASVINANIIGKNCTIYQQVTVGKGKMVNSRSTPNIGNNVTIYAGAIVIGGITIGDNVEIGAGTVVVKDIPDNCTVVGNPARVI